MIKRHTRIFEAAAVAFAACAALIVLPALSWAGGSPPVTEVAEGAAAEEASGSGAPFDLKDPKRIEAGRSTFNATCASYCHGQNPSLFMGRSDLSEQYVYDTIRDGGKGATPMPPWGDVFSPEEIWELIAYLKSLGTW